eukprot:UN30349
MWVKLNQFIPKYAYQSVQSDDYPYWQFVPRFTGIVPYPKKDVESFQWSGRCFKSFTATTSLTANHTLTMTVEGSKHHALCLDEVYLFATVKFFHLGVFGAENPKSTITFDLTKLSVSELWDIQTKGIRIFQFKEGAAKTIGSLTDTVEMFTPMAMKKPSKNAEEKNVEFLKKYVGIDMQPRNNTGGPIIIDETMVKSGDFFGIVRLDGLDTLLGWGMGSSTGHNTMAMWEDNQLYVMESQVKSAYWPTDNIQKTPYRTWLQQAYDAGYNLVHIPLKDSVRAAFNVDDALKFFKSVEGVMYGYHNLLMGWLDTKTDNFPCLPPDFDYCLSPELVEVLFPIVVNLVPATGIVWVEAMNQRTKTQNLKLSDVYYIGATKYNMDFVDLYTAVEEDSF